MRQNEITEYKQATDDLKELFAKVSNSGKTAWRVGDKLKSVKDSKQYRIDYQTFANYTKKEFKKSAQTANTYIAIRENFKYNEISDNILVTYLKTILDFNNSSFGKMLLNILNEIDKSGNKLPSNNDIHTTLRLLSNSSNLTQKQVKTVLRDIENNTKDNKRKTSNNKAKVGKEIKNTKYAGIEKVITYEPVDEQGFVALFCCLFPFIKKVEFVLQKEKISFKKIQYVRTAFPDSEIRCKILNKRKEFFQHKKVEFEFESSNYLKHKHQVADSANECDFIIAWVDDLKKKKLDDETKKLIPPILSIKQLLYKNDFEFIKL